MITLADFMAEARRQALTESRILRESLPPAEPVTPQLNYRFRATCPRCGGPLKHVTGSAEPRTIGLEARTVTHCGKCQDTFVLTVAFVSETKAQRARNSITAETERYARSVA